MDPVADMFAAIKNGYLSKKETVAIPYSRFKLTIATVLASSKFIAGVKKSSNKLEISLAYPDNEPAITEIKRVSKLGLRLYTKSKNIKNPKGGKGILIVSTPGGVMSGTDARRKKLGGEVIAKVW